MSSAKPVAEPTKEKVAKKVTQKEEEDEEDDDEEEQPEVKAENKDEDLTNQVVLSKYKQAAEIANEAVAWVMKTAKGGIAISELCKGADALIIERTSKLYSNKKDVAKGIGFPTCISPNNVVGHFSPLTSDSTPLKTGDIVKVDLGVHIDGYLAVAAQTFAVGNEESTTPHPITGRVADAYAAALVASDCALRLLKPGNKNNQVSEIIDKVCKDFNVKAVQGVLSHQLKRNLIDGDKVIINRQEVEQKVDECEFQVNEVYAIDIVMSTGEGKPRELDTRQTTVFKRNAANTYNLKQKISRSVLAEIDKHHSKFPFNLRALDSEGEAKAKFGINEAVQHELVQPYPVLMMPQGAVRITGPGLEVAKHIQTSHKATNEDVLKTLQISLSNPGAAKKNNKKKKKKPAAAAAAPAQ